MKTLSLFFILACNAASFASTEKYETVWDRIMKEQSYANLYKGMSLMKNGEYSKASVEFSKALDKNPDSMAYAMFGASLYWMGDVDASLEKYEKALSLDQKNAMAWQLKGISEAKKGDPEKALESFGKALEIAPDSGDAAMNTGSVNFAMGHMSSALQYTRTAVSADPKNPLYRYQLGLIYFRLERYEEAASCFKKALSLYRDYEEAVLWLGLVEERSGSPEKAVNEYKKAVAMKPFDFFARYRLCLAALKKGDKTAIKKYIEKSFSLSPKNDEGGVSLFLSYSGSPEDSAPVSGGVESFFGDAQKIYENLSKTSPEEEIRFSVDLISASRPVLKKVSGDSLKNALGKKSSAPSRKYVSKEYFIPAGTGPGREEAIKAAVRSVEKEIKDLGGGDYRLNFSMNTRKVSSPGDKEKTPEASYYPRKIGNDMGLWIVGNNWIGEIEEDMEDADLNAADPSKNLVYGLGLLLLGDSVSASEMFEKSSGEYYIFSCLGEAVSAVCRGKKDEAGAYLKKVLEKEPENKTALENMKWLYGK